MIVTKTLKRIMGRPRWISGADYFRRIATVGNSAHNSIERHKLPSDHYVVR